MSDVKDETIRLLNMQVELPVPNIALELCAEDNVERVDIQLKLYRRSKCSWYMFRAGLGLGSHHVGDRWRGQFEWTGGSCITRSPNLFPRFWPTTAILDVVFQASASLRKRIEIRDDGVSMALYRSIYLARTTWR